MTDCDPKNKFMIQMDKAALLRCEDPCTHKSFISFDHEDLKNKVSQLQSSVSHDLMQNVFADLFSGIQSIGQLAQQPNLTKFNNPPLPRTKVPPNPCTDPNAGAPTLEHKRAA